MLFCLEMHANEAKGSVQSRIAQFRYIKIQPKTIDLSTRLVGITTEFVGFIPTSLVLRSIVLGWILIYRNWAIDPFASFACKTADNCDNSYYFDFRFGSTKVEIAWVVKYLMLSVRRAQGIMVVVCLEDVAPAMNTTVIQLIAQVFITIFFLFFYYI